MTIISSSSFTTNSASTKPSLHRRNHSLGSPRETSFGSNFNLTSPQLEDVISKSARFFHKKISIQQLLPSESAPTKYRLLDERRYPIDTLHPNPSKPSEQEISEYLTRISTIGELCPTAIAIGIHYLEKILSKHSDFTLLHYNWKRTLTACVILGCKAYEELGVQFSDFLHKEAFPFLYKKDLKRLEAFVLDLLDFSLEWNIKDYTNVLLTVSSL